jgi:hypothetical protein
MEQSLDEYLKTHKCEGFSAVPHYFAEGDYVTFYFRDERCYERRVDDLLTVYLSMATNDLMGCKIKSVKHLLETAGNLFVSIDAGKVKLAFLFALGERVARDPEQKRYYSELAVLTKDAELQIA